jgi:hypothetical protein
MDELGKETRSSFRGQRRRQVGGLPRSTVTSSPHFHPFQKLRGRGSWGSALGKLLIRVVCTYHREAIGNFHKEALDLKPQLVSSRRHLLLKMAGPIRAGMSYLL